MNSTSNYFAINTIMKFVMDKKTIIYQRYASDTLKVKENLAMLSLEISSSSMMIYMSGNKEKNMQTCIIQM